MNKTTLIAVLAAGTAAAQPTFPFTETFDSDTADWVPGSTPAGLTPVFGSEGGNGFLEISTPLTPTFGTSQTIAQAQAFANSSGGALTGNYLAGGITQISFDVRHDSTTDLSFAIRLATGNNFPAFVVTDSTAVSAGSFTTLTFDLALSNPNLTEELPGTFFGVLGDVTFLQIIATGITPAIEGQQVAFQLDNVSIDVPAPGATAILAAGGVIVARRRRG